MPTFICHAVDDNGKTVKKTLQADTAELAKQQLSQQKMVVFEVVEAQSRSARQPRLSMTQKMLFTRQLSTLLGAGYTLEAALRSCGRQNPDSPLYYLSTAIHRRVTEGIAFNQALAEYPKLFDSTFCATVKAGENSGHLDAVLARLADHSEAAQNLRDSIRQALIYPLILFVVATLMIIYLMTAVIPDVVKVFNSSGQQLPAMTRGLLGLSNVIGQYGLYIAIAGAIAIWLWRRLASGERQILRRHRLWLRLPILSPLIKQYQAANYSSTLAILLNAGVKLLDALQIAAQTVSNRVMQQATQQAVDEVGKGKSLAQALTIQKQLFPGMLIELIDSGERTGQLAGMLEKAGTIYHQQSRARIKTLTSLLGPLMILLMGGLVFAVVLAILLPIFDLNQAIK